VTETSHGSEENPETLRMQGASLQATEFAAPGEDIDGQPSLDLLNVVAAAIARGETQAAAGLRVRRSERTVRRWAELPQFQEAIATERQRMRGELVNERLAARVRAQEVLTKLLDSRNESIQLRAAIAAMEIAAMKHEDDQIADRIEVIEARQAQGWNGP
jgi:hypothetical protein